MQQGKKAVVVFSGGQDSTTCLGMAVKKHGADAVHAVGFNYGQRHAVELVQAQKIAGELGVSFEVVPLPLINKFTSALTNTVDDVSKPHARMANVPASFVPVRNALMLTLAHGIAQELGAEEIWTGVCQTDYSGYPDCRAEFIAQLAHALNAGYNSRIVFQTPLMYINKAATFRLAAEAGVLELVIQESHTCYNGVRADDGPDHDWGHGCGECPACKLRAKGWEEYLEYQAANADQ